ncbi:MAG: GNAT family N-acetyltransferase [Muribaculaceae bacterium]|nr:GNAT family N-acetyltransferase [Muribaculaceae bacterium]
MNQQPIIPPVPTHLLEAELTQERFLRVTNKGSNLIFVVDAFNAPNVMKEVGRLREIAFRHGGGGTGLECDIDEFDTMQPPCKQLIVWDPEEKMILGGYRFILGKDIVIRPDGSPRIATAHLFHFSQRFIRDYLPYTIELGRSFVRLEFQSSRAGNRGKAIFVLDNLWDGLGALTVLHPEVKYLFGKMTMYPNYNADCRNMILYFLMKYFPDSDALVTPLTPLATGMDLNEMAKNFTADNFKGDYRILNTLIREYGINIPPLVNAYMSLSPTMKVFGTAINHEFGEVEETGIFLAISDIFEDKKQRHIGTFVH